jgi:hypothetical protein
MPIDDWRVLHSTAEFNNPLIPGFNPETIFVKKNRGFPFAPRNLFGIIARKKIKKNILPEITLRA